MYGQKKICIILECFQLVKLSIVSIANFMYFETLKMYFEVRIFFFQDLTQKKLTKDGRDRKDRIIHKIFTERAFSKMVMGLYSSVFPLLKNFVLLFEMKVPLIHQLHEEQVCVCV